MPSSSRLQFANGDVPYQLFVVLPYLAAILTLVGAGRPQPPAPGLGAVSIDGRAADPMDGLIPPGNPDHRPRRHRASDERIDRILTAAVAVFSRASGSTGHG